MDDFYKAYEMLNNLLQDMNINEITEHIKQDNLNLWLMHWRSAMRVNIAKLKECR